MSNTPHGLLFFWVQESTRYSIVGAIHGECPDAIEVLDYESADAPAVVRTIVRQADESANGIWQRALDTMKDFKRARPFNASQSTQGLFRFRYGETVDQAEAGANDCYRNLRHQAVWTTRNGATEEIRTAAKAALGRMAEQTNDSILERALANLEITALCGLLTRAEKRTFEQWAEEHHAATPIGDSESLNRIGRQLALRVLKLLEGASHSVGTLQ
ncbi:hypothetical protein ACYZTL_03215 [Pseudomonas sp. LB3P81]